MWRYVGPRVTHDYFSVCFNFLLYIIIIPNNFTWISKIKVKVKWSRYRPGAAQKMGRGIALLFHNRDTRRGWVVSSTPRPCFTPGKDPVPILQETGCAPGPVCTGGKSRPHRDSIPDRPARNQSLYRLSYRAHSVYLFYKNFNKFSSIFHVYEWPWNSTGSQF